MKKIKKYNNSLKRLLKEILNFKTLFIITILVLTITIALKTLVPVIIQKTIDSFIIPALNNNIEKTFAIEKIKLSSIIILSTTLASAIFLLVGMLLSVLLSQNIMSKLRTKTMKHVLNLSLDYHHNTPTGHIVSTLTNDVETIDQFFSKTGPTIVTSFFMMFASMFAIISLNYKLGLITIATFIPITIFSTIFSKVSKKTYSQIREETSQLNTFFSEYLSGIKIVKLFNREEKSMKIFSDKNINLLTSLIKEVKIFGIFKPLSSLFTSISTAIIIFIGAVLYKKNLVSIGTVVAFIALSKNFYQPIMNIAEQFAKIQSAIAGSERVYKLLDTENSIDDNGDKNFPTKKAPTIEIKNLNFSYKKDQPTLKNISFNMPSGTTTAIVGHTGSGKTTIANLITRMWEKDSGEILINNTKIEDIKLKELRENVISVQQDPFIFSGTIKENIDMGLNLSIKEIKEAAKNANAHSFIENLRNKYDTILVEGGKNISTGQKQLLTFARILAHNPEVIILDEATGNIDSQSEEKIQQAIKKLFSNRTNIVIAHRLSTIKNADNIIVLEKGKIVEQGTHNQLLKKDSAYKKLYEKQFKENSKNPNSC